MHRSLKDPLMQTLQAPHLVALHFRNPIPLFHSGWVSQARGRNTKLVDRQRGVLPLQTGPRLQVAKR